MWKAIIIGGGIGGLAAAVALRRKGHEAHVYEAAPAIEPVGKGIWVPTNAMQVLERLGLADAIYAAGWPLERIEIRTRTGALLMDVDVLKVRARYGHPTVSIHRAALVDVLAGALPSGTLHLGKRLASFEQTAQGVVARFADGDEVRGDLIIGADGIRSVLREQLFPGVRLRYGGQTCYRGIAEIELPVDLATICREVWGGDSRMGYSAIGRRQVYWFAPVSAPADSRLLPPAELHDELLDRYARFPAPILDILRGTSPAEIIRTDLYEIEALDRWWQGRAVLLGDAAHAMTPNLGQGGAQAIEDAYILADCLAAGSNLEQAFEAYGRCRRSRVRWIAQTARRLGQAAHFSSPVLRWLRDLAMRATPAWYGNAQVDRLARLPEGSR